MSHAQEPHRPSFSFGNPFRKISAKGSQLSPRLLSLLNSFEETLAYRFKKLHPEDKKDILTFAWMELAVISLCETHTDVKSLITALKLPVNDWDDGWMDVFLDISGKLLNICNAFSSELSRLNQGHLILRCALHNLESNTQEQFVKARSSLDSWRQHITPENPRTENCRAVRDSLLESFYLPEAKNSAKGKLLMRAMYGVTVQTVFLCSVLAAAFSGSPKHLLDLEIPSTISWARAYLDLQTNINKEIRQLFHQGKFTVIKELDILDSTVKELHRLIQDGSGQVEAEALKNSCTVLKVEAEKLSQGLDLLTKEVDGFFKIVLTGRDALLCN